jgi:hypothetical protein
MDTRFRNHIAAVRVFLAVFFALLGSGLLFSTSDGGRLLLGAVLGALGITSLLLLWAEMRTPD